jgi:PQQ system protein
MLAIGTLLSGCGQTRQRQPTMLKQMDTDVARAVNALAESDPPNQEVIGQLFVNGGSAHAAKGADGVFRIEVRVPENQLIWQPAIIQMEHGGELELDFYNTDQTPHGVYMPSNPERQVMILPTHTGGRVRVQLDQPGLYWFGCPVSNHAGRGMLGLVLVGGEVPAEARLDRPKQRRP